MQLTELDRVAILEHATRIVRKALPEERTGALSEALHMCYDYYHEQANITSDDIKDKNLFKAHALMELLVLFGFKKKGA